MISDLNHCRLIDWTRGHALDVCIENGQVFPSPAVILGLLRIDAGSYHVAVVEVHEIGMKYTRLSALRETVSIACRAWRHDSSESCEHKA